jgi:hypothetical protein
MLLLAWPAAAQDRPQLVPSRDVSVAYRAIGGGEGRMPELRMSWLVARGLLRVDMGEAGYLVTDTRGAGGFMVMAAQRMVMDLPAGANPAAAPGLLREGARYTREGNDRVAGLPCTNWRIEAEGETNRACITADGVMLRAATAAGGRSGEGVLEAVSVSQGPQDPARFERPPGYQNFQPPGRAAPPAGGNALPRGTALPPPR